MKTVFKQVAEANELARVTIVQLQDLERIISQAERDAVLDKRFIDTGFRQYWPFNRRKA